MSSNEPEAHHESLTTPPLPIKRVVEELVRQVEVADLPSAQYIFANSEQNILVDVTVRGFRCIITRTPPPTLTITLPISLSPRELEVARMVAKGYPNKTIAAVLDISSWTVGTYLRRMFAKLGVRTRAALISELHQQGLLHEYSGTREPSIPSVNGTSSSRAKFEADISRNNDQRPTFDYGQDRLSKPHRGVV